MDSAARAGYMRRARSFIPSLTNGSCFLPRLDLLHSLFIGLLFTRFWMISILYAYLVVPGSRHATAGGQADCFHKALTISGSAQLRLFPHLGE